MSDFEAPRQNLIRMAEGVEVRAEGDGRTLTGYAAVFDTPTEIKSWEGNFIERIAPGAFKRTLRNNGDQVKVLFNHGMDPSIGDKPLGKPRTMKEDARGLFVEVPLDRTSYNEDLIASLESGAISGQSFRFSVVRDSWTQPKRKGDLPQRTVEEAKLYEFGPVTFPAYAAASAGVRSREEFSIWRSLDEESRTAIEDILGTSLGEPAASTASDSEPSATTPALTNPSLVRARLLNHGVDQWLESMSSAQS